jgi:hypothetical protein
MKIPPTGEEPLANRKHEAFARELAKFKTNYEAAVAAGYHASPALKQNSHRLSQQSDVKARVLYLQKVSGVAAAIDSKYVQRKLLDIIETGDLVGADIKPSDRLKALELMCKVNGLFAPQKIAPTNPEGTGPYEPTDADRVAVLEKFLARVKLKP